MRKAKKKKKKKKNAKNENVEEQPRTTNKYSGYTLCTRCVEEMGMQFMSGERRGEKDNTNLGMMLPGTLLHENTRIKKILFWHIFIHKKGLYRISLHR